MKTILSCIALVVSLSACNKEAAAPVKVARPALTQVVGAAAAANRPVYSGEIRARHETGLSFRVGGKLVARLVEAGSQVRAGQVLARLDAADAGLQADAAQAQFQQAEAEVKRFRELRGKGFVSQSALDAKETAFKAAAAQAGLTRNQSGYTTLRAEHDGVVAVTLAEAGQVVAAGQPVLRLAQSGELEVAIALPETQFAGHKPGDKAEITLLADEGAVFGGQLRELSPIADPVSRSYAARVAFVAPAGKVALGMTARVRFVNPVPGKPVSGAGDLIIPLSAIYQQGKQTAVWVVAADRGVSLRQVTVAAYRDAGAIISDGLNPGERIVSAGVHRLSPGEKILIIDSVAEGGEAR